MSQDNKAKARPNRADMRNLVVDRMYQQALQEAPASAENLLFFAKSCGLSVADAPDYTPDGLVRIEAWYRNLCREQRFGSTEPLDRRSFERLMTYFLGETLIRQEGAEWFAYKGKYYVCWPVLVRFPDTGKALDIGAICQDLIDSRMVGVRDGTVLRRLFDRAKKIALI